MSIDYDAPRSHEEEPESVLPELRVTGPEEEPDEAELAQAYQLPGADLSGVELAVQVLPQQNDEFTCPACFLVRHRSQLASTGGPAVCTECAA